MHVERSKRKSAILAVVAIAIGILYWSWKEQPELGERALGKSTGSAQLVSIEEWPDVGEMCMWEPASADSNLIAGLEENKHNNLFAAFRTRSVYAASQDASGTTDVTRPPVRRILDTDPIYTAIAVDTRTDEVFLQDTNTWSIRIFNRLDNTPPNATRTEPKRVIRGPKSDIQFNSSIHIDANGDIYSVENDTGDSIIVFSRNADGDVEPVRKLHVTHRAYAITVDEEKQELYVAVQSTPQVEVFRKTASGDEKPLRVLRGVSTRLAATHGIALDVKNKLLFVNNWGHHSRYYDDTGAGGTFGLPSITVYPLDAKGDTAPLRVIQGPKTQLNWPGLMSLDPESGDLYVANDVGQSILVFSGTDRGDVAPTRVLKGPRTGLSYPVGVTIDTKNKELWVSNLGNASATVYPLTANGDVAPLRTIRSAPRGKVSLRFGKTDALAYDSRREEILVPN